jgi:hypothetical protein
MGLDDLQMDSGNLLTDGKYSQGFFFDSLERKILTVCKEKF